MSIYAFPPSSFTRHQGCIPSPNYLILHDATLRRRTPKTRNNTHNLELDGLALELNGANLEVDTDRGDVALRVSVVRETEKQARLEQALI